MGKSDAIIMPWYTWNLQESFGLDYSRVCFLGFTGENEFTRQIRSPIRDFYDLSLGNWDINGNWSNIVDESYDLVVCTRCAYFSMNPDNFLKECHRITKPNGVIFVDWGLGDHWRFYPIKVGWVDNSGEQEYSIVNKEKSYLWSTFWDRNFESHSEAVKFKNCLPYLKEHTVTEAVKKEVPYIVSSLEWAPYKINLLMLWPESPQLYILTIFKR